MNFFTNEQDQQFERLADMFRAHGYFVAAEPIKGMEVEFLADLIAAASRIEREAASLRSAYGYRGISKRLKEELHNSLPAPSFNVESAVAAELRAKENRRKI